MLGSSGSFHRLSSQSRQRGAVGAGLILLMLSMVLFLSLAVDTGRLYMEKRQLQKQADLAALSLGRGACYIDGSNETKKQTLIAQAKSNLQQNGFDPDANQYDVTFGAASIDQAQSQWTFDSSNAVKSAGKVTLSKTIPASIIAQALNDDDVTLSASATVMKRMSVGFGIGSRTVDVDLTNSVLGAALGGSLAIGSYQGLADTKVRLAGLLSALNDMGLLAVDLSAGTLEQVLDTQLTVAQFIEANIRAVSEYDVLDAGVLPALTQMKSLAQVSTLSLALSDIITLAAGSNEAMNDEIRRAALASKIALFDLVSGAIYASNKDNFLLIPNLDVDLGVAGLAVALKVIEPPQFTMGVLPAESEDGFVTSVSTSQVELKLKATLFGGGLDLGLLALNVGTIGLSAEVAKAETQLLDANGCQLLSGNGVSMSFATKPSVALIKVGDGGPPNDATDFGDVTQPITIGAYVRVLPIVTVPVEIDITANVPVSTSDYITHSHTVDPELELPQLIGNVSPPIGSTLSDTLSNIELDAELNVADIGLISAVLNLVLSLLTDTVLPLVATLLNSLLLSVLEPILSDVLGIQVGSADVFVTSIEVDGGNLIQ
ncbi:pilus assembly protein TadG-related protein [Photobacterium sp. 1_MG-2023]|uniref:pilus assembly protein TadG-related protein n=1 Tax=Photobacterium sp. 1_MG-2023 TaxID=3062646 RepID=UPI0026E35D62|nr:pilus assembly protein TadG-related protein [Photobacterium sp. 1_MG-2023]MDO6708773.1 pilus assembly protein TadG-related protein [Photobacterium sp. 1_MG-2023]